MHKNKSSIATALLMALAAQPSVQADLPGPTPAPDVFTAPGSPIGSNPFAPQVPAALLPPPQFEKCYGVAGKDQNHCEYAPFDGSNLHGAGQAKACDPAAWRWVPAGYCRRIVVGTDKSGKMLTGTLAPSYARGFPEVCSPFDPQNVPPNDSGF